MPFDAEAAERGLTGPSSPPRGFDAVGAARALSQPRFDAAGAERALSTPAPQPQNNIKPTSNIHQKPWSPLTPFEHINQAELASPVTRPVAQWAGQRARNLGDAMQWISQSPFGRGVDAILGTPERAEQSAIVEGNPLKGVFDPEGSLGVTHRLEHKELDRPLAAIHAQVPTKGWGQTALDFATQTAHDPWTQAAILATLGSAIPGVDAIAAPVAAALDPLAAARFAGRTIHAAGGGKLASAVSRAIPEPMKMGISAAVDKAKSDFSTSHDPLKGYSQSGLNLQRAREGGMRLLRHQRMNEYHAALLPMEKEINQLDTVMRERGLNATALRTPEGINSLPPANRRTLRRINVIMDKVLWREGTPEVRSSMRARGFKPTAEEAALPHTNLVSIDFGNRYLPEQQVYDKAAMAELQAARGWSYNRGGVKKSRFDISKDGFASPEAPLFQRLGERLESSAYLEPKRRMEQTMIRELGLTPSQAGRTHERIAELQKRLDLTPRREQLLGRLSPEQRSAAEQLLKGEVDVVADPKVMSTVGKIQKDSFKHIAEDGVTRIQFKANREGGANQAVGTQYEVHPITKEFYESHMLPPNTNLPYESFLREVSKPENLGYRPTHAQLSHGKLSDVGTAKIFENYFNHPVRSKYAIKVDNFESPEARFWGGLDDSTSAHITPENVMEHQSSPAADPKVMETVRRVQNADARRNVLQKHIGKYNALLGRQTEEALANVGRQEKYLNPDAVKTEMKLPGVLRGEEEATARAIRDSGFLGKSLEAAFTPEGERLGHGGTGVATERANRTAIEARRAQALEEHARKKLRRSKESLAKETARAASAVEEGKGILGKQAEKGYDAAIKAERDLTAGLKKVPSLSKERQVGYARSGGEILDGFEPETQTLLNRRGQMLRGKIDPAYEALLRATQTQSINRPFQQTATQISRIGGKSTTKPLADLSGSLQKNVVARTQAATNAASKQHKLLQQNAAVKELEKRLAADPRYQPSLSLPSPVHERLFGPTVYPTPNILEAFAGRMRNALFSNPFPHYLGNILEQQTLAGGGLGSTYKGILESHRLAKKDPAALKRLEEAQRHGALYEQGYEDSIEGTNPFSRATRTVQKGLTHGEQGQASHLFHKHIGEGMSPEDAAEEVRQTFGRPHEYSAVAKTSRHAGEPFGNWVLSTVPRSTRKMLKNPANLRGLETYARAIRDTNEDVFEPEYGVDWNPGGFASRAAELLLEPGAYVSSQSLKNPLSTIGEESKTYPLDMVTSLIPYSGSIKDAVMQPLTDKERARGGYKPLPLWMRGLSAARGGYFRHAEAPKHAFFRELQRRGLLNQ